MFPGIAELTAFRTRNFDGRNLDEKVFTVKVVLGLNCKENGQLF